MVVNLRIDGEVVSQVLWHQGEAIKEDLRYLGDADCDGRSGSVDAALMLQQGAGLVGLEECVHGLDVNRDGVENATDAALVLQFEAALIPYFS
jgi:hypothetical protein